MSDEYALQQAAPLRARPEDGERASRGPGQIRRYPLPRVAPASRSAPGHDRLERLEEISAEATAR